MAKIRITEAFELLEKAYKKHGDIMLAIRLNEERLIPILATGIAVVDPTKDGIDNYYFCFCPDGNESSSTNS